MNSSHRRMAIVAGITFIVAFLGACGAGSANPAASASRRALDGKIIADMGFRPEIDGFAFENYSNDGVINLTEAEMLRLFGAGAFEVSENGAKVLSPTAREWMDVVNDAMNGGHCEGLAVSSLLFHARRLDPAKFGSSVAYDLSKENPALQREIAYWWATQVTTPTAESKIYGTPSEIVDLLVEAFRKPGNQSPLYDIHIYLREGGGGHAVTPYAVREKDQNLVEILCYDNNHPGMERVIEVNRSENTWSYSAARNPSEAEARYGGDAETQNLILVPMPPRLTAADNPFEEDADFADEEEGEEEDEDAGAVGTGRPRRATPVEIWLDGPADLLITDKQGRRLGTVGGRTVNEIPGASVRYFLGAGWTQVEEEPVYVIPAGIPVTISLSGARLKEAASSDISIFGAGYSIEVNEVMLEPGQVDVITFAADGSAVTYKPSGDESPDLIIAFRTKGADYEFEVGDFEVSEGGALEMGIEFREGRVRVAAPGSEDGASLGLYGYRLERGAEELFENDDVTLEAGEAGYLYFKGWKGAGSEMKFGIDENGDRKPDRELTLDDEDLARD